MMENCLSHSQLDSLKNILEEQKQSLEISRKSKLDEMKVLQDHLKDLGDIASFEIDAEKTWLLINRDETYQSKIATALKRLDGGNYGYCVECDSPISFKRLTFDPTAELCIDCKNELEQHDQKISAHH